MVQDTASCQALELPEGQTAPSLIHLLPKGAFQGRDGRAWRLDDIVGLIARFRLRKIDLPIDYEHQADDPARAKNGPVPAAGWIHDLEQRADGVWGHVKWTETATNMIQERAYRYLSPVFRFDKHTMQVSTLLSAGLVHRPNLELTALASEETKMPKDQTVLNAITTALGLPDSASQEQIMGKIVSLNQSEPDPAKYVPIDAVRDLMRDRGSKVELARESDVEAAVNTALDGGYITPGMRNWATALCRQDPASFAEFTKSAAPAYAHLFKSQLEGKTLPDHKPQAYGDAELAICTQLDIDPSSLSNG